MNLIFAGVATTLLVIRALSRKSLTISGILAAVLTAAVHAIHPWNLPFILLITFYGLGTAATKVKHDVKSKLTLSSSGSSGGETARNHIQVFANSIIASILILLHAKQLHTHPTSTCFHNRPDDLLIIGIISNYAATLSDTLSSELGILSRTPPRLITTLRPTPPGTNGGVTLYGLTAGAAGSAIIGIVSVVFLPACETTTYSWEVSEKIWFVAFVTFVGVLGSVVDSVLGAVFQQSVVDVRSGKVVEAPNGAKVLVHPTDVRLSVHAQVRSRLGRASQSSEAAVAEMEEVKGRGNSRKVVAGVRWGVLSNNMVNLVMAGVVSVVGMVLWGGLGRVGAVLGEQVRTVVTAVVKQELIGAVVKGVLGV